MDINEQVFLVFEGAMGVEFRFLAIHLVKVTSYMRMFLVIGRVI